jgi:hypothetical protein
MLGKATEDALDAKGLCLIRAYHFSSPRLGTHSIPRLPRVT